MPEQPLLDVVIVAWNTRDYLPGCLASLASVAAGDGVALGRVAVVDNASTDGGMDALPPVDLPLGIVRNPRNEGFAVAVNQGARLGAAPFILLLNPDITLLPGSLRTPLDFMRSEEAVKVGVCGIKTLTETGEVHRSSDRYPTAGRYWVMMLGLTAMAPRLFQGMRLTNWDHLDSRAVDHVIGAFYFIRRPLFERLGGLDERFFVYLEDIDLSRRVTESGSEVRYLASAAAIHVGGGSSNQVKALRLALNLMSRCQYSLKHMNPLKAASVIFGTAVVEPAARLSAALVTGGIGQFRETLRGYAILARWAFRKLVGAPDSRRPPQ